MREWGSTGVGLELGLGLAAPANAINPSAGGGFVGLSCVKRSPAAGYGERRQHGRIRTLYMATNPDTQADPRVATASVPFPPPLAFFGGLALGFGTDYFLPAPILRSSSGIDALRLAGVALGTVSLTLAGFALLSFRLAKTSPFPNRPSTSLIIRGPFRLTRNPVYLGGALLHTGVALFANALWPLLFLVPAVVVVHKFIIREERYLHQRFGTEYEAYCQQVRRWV